ncbi:DUF4097 family beta strand repeat protein [Actinomadura barringtoniae]|uniref:DUF4097 family beta strand repeat protein n=1 Tax=Actinomadura barringtoniae TaxID=1427535 RepID=A0A939T3I2_9ACTN|nr:DUF4097 family beta strand repeat-containing protein [Actinomadura barringtoniae]MBO2448148.1 DUF4097 family beta strand repeat protein [Actinomadura barringtoniae]
MKTLMSVAVLAGAAIALAGCRVDVNTETHHEDRSYAAPDAKSIKVSGAGGKVEIVGSDSPGIKVEERLTWTSEHRKPEPKHVIQNGTLSLSATCKGHVIGFSNCGVSYKIQVPRDTGLDLHNDDGAVTVSDVQGAIRVTTDTGSIEANALRATSLYAKTGDGTVRASGEVGSAEFHTDTGSVAATALRTDKLIAGSGDGTLSFGLTQPPNSVKLTADTGDVKLKLPFADVKYALDASTDTGNVDKNGIPVDSASPHKITIKTGDGNITITPA